MKLEIKPDLDLETLEDELNDIVQTILKLRKTPPELISLDDIEIWKEDVKVIPKRIVEIIQQVNKEVKERDKERVF